MSVQSKEKYLCLCTRSVERAKYNRSPLGTTDYFQSPVYLLNTRTERPSPYGMKLHVMNLPDTIRRALLVKYQPGVYGHTTK
jgi:hypothetical protein